MNTFFKGFGYAIFTVVAVANAVASWVFLFWYGYDDWAARVTGIDWLSTVPFFLWVVVQIITIVLSNVMSAIAKAMKSESV